MMSNDDAARLVNLLVATWGTGPKAYVWTNALADLDAPPANRAYVKLRDSAERITVASYLAAYRHELDATTPGRARRDPSEHCPHCRGCGYEDGPPEYETVNGEQHEYSTLVPCRCTRPRAASRAPSPAALFEEF